MKLRMAILIQVIELKEKYALVLSRNDMLHEK